jgi:hypothetical protein
VHLSLLLKKYRKFFTVKKTSLKSLLAIYVPIGKNLGGCALIACLRLSNGTCLGNPKRIFMQFWHENIEKKLHIRGELGKFWNGKVIKEGLN